MTSALVLKEISYRYATKPELALDGVSLRIPIGQCTGVLGPNGAGKSTLLSIMVGLIDPLSGELRVNDDRPADKKTLKRTCAIVPQEYAFYPALTALENLDFFAGLYGLVGAKKQERVDIVVAICGLQQILHTPSERYSGGLKRRLNLAIGLLPDPKILFLDEPTVGIDAQSRNFILDAIKSLRDQGMTIVYTSHYMEEIEAICDHIAVIDHGKLLVETSLSELVSSSDGKWVRIRLSQVLTDEQLLRCQQVLHADRQLSQQISQQNSQERSQERSQQGTQLTGYLNPQSTELEQLVETIKQMNVVIEEIHFGASRLEDIYLSLTKTTLRD